MSDQPETEVTVHAGATRPRPTRAVKAVIPAAGLATRFLPATKAVPKELLPVVDRPVLQYIVEEATAAGIKRRPADHRPGQDLDGRPLRPPPRPGGAAGGEGRRRSARRRPRPSELAEIYTCRQHEPLGLGHAVSLRAVACGRRAVRGAARRRVRRAERAAAAGDAGAAGAYRRHRARLLRGAAGETKRYGIASVAPTDGEFADLGEVVEVTGLVEKPRREEAPEQPGRPRPLRPAGPTSSRRSGGPNRAPVARSS